MSRRLKNISVSVPIVYGNDAEKLTPEMRKPNTPVDHTHEWTVFFKPVVGEVDLTPLIKKVTFKLHETYENPVRSIEKPPYQVTETGWGEFEIIIKIHFHLGAELAINEKNFQIFHGLKLHPYNPQTDHAGAAQTTLVAANGDVHLVIYDELVFSEPTEYAFALLTKYPVNMLPHKLTDADRRDQEYIKLDETDELARLEVYLKKIKDEIETQRQEYNDLEQEKFALVQ